MTVPVQNPDATEAILELYDIKAALALAVDRIIQPVAIIDDGWARVTLHAFNDLAAASTAVHNNTLLAAEPNFAQKLLYLRYVGTGNVTGVMDLRVEVSPAISTAFTSLDYDQFTLDGVADPEEVFSREILEGSQPVAPAGTGWTVRVPATGVAETIQVSALIARIPRRIRPY